MAPSCRRSAPASMRSLRVVITLVNARSMSGSASTRRARSARKRSASSSAVIDSAFCPCRLVNRYVPRSGLTHASLANASWPSSASNSTHMPRSRLRAISRYSSSMISRGGLRRLRLGLRHRLGERLGLRRRRVVARRLRHLGLRAAPLRPPRRWASDRRDERRLDRRRVRLDEVGHERLALVRRPPLVVHAGRQPLQERRQQRDQVLAVLGRALRLHAPHEVLERGHAPSSTTRFPRRPAR